MFFFKISRILVSRIIKSLTDITRAPGILMVSFLFTMYVTRGGFVGTAGHTTDVFLGAELLQQYVTSNGTQFHKKQLFGMLNRPFQFTFLHRSYCYLKSAEKHPVIRSLPTNFSKRHLFICKRTFIQNTKYHTNMFSACPFPFRSSSSLWHRTSAFQSAMSGV